MANLLIAIFFLSIWHIVADGIIAPSMRLESQIRLFKLRDRLRRAKFEEASQIEVDVYSALQSAINFSVRYVSTINLYDVLLERPKLSIEEEAEVSRVVDMVSKSKCAEARSIQRDLEHVWLYAMGANSLGWVIYVVPPLLCAVAFDRIKRYAKMLLFAPGRNVFRDSSDDTEGQAA